MGNATSSVAEIKKKGDDYHKAAARERAGGLVQQMSSKRFKKNSPTAEQWKVTAYTFQGSTALSTGGMDRQSLIFNDLDVQDDKLMLDLAVFLQRLVNRFPEGGGALMRHGVHLPKGDELMEHPMMPNPRVNEFLSSPTTDDDDDGEDNGLSIENIAMASGPTPSLVRIGSVYVNLEPHKEDNLMDYTLPKGAPTIATVEEVMQLFETGGKLNVKTVRKVLRDAYKILKELPNINRVPLETPEVSVTVVGDLHGQLADLIHLINKNGMPSATNKYIFNGDFVDRGMQGVEILIILFLLMTACPKSVFLNRGNHEDFGLCCVYGFQKECLNKYNDVVFSMFCEMFRHLPVCSVIHDKVLVIHGGLFHREGVMLSDLEEVERLDYVVPARAEDREEYLELSETERRQRDLRTIMHCALWSDPDLSPSLPHPQPNPRGAGVLFGPDSTAVFLNDNALDMVVRSHECVEEGFDLPFENEMEGSCATIFSASNYGGSMNQGATVRFSLKETASSYMAGGVRATKPEVFYTVYDYQLSRGDRKDGENLLKANQTGLSSLVLRKKRPLVAAFSQVDKEGSGFIAKERWCKVMENITGLKISWMAMANIVIDEEDVKGDKVNWSAFMSKFHVKLSARAKNLKDGEAMFDAMYADREKLEAIFRFFDTDSNGSISREEFFRGCELINEQAPTGQELENLDAILDVMDIDNNNSIDINEFFEVFRLVDAADGNVDGRFLPKQRNT